MTERWSDFWNSIMINHRDIIARYENNWKTKKSNKKNVYGVIKPLKNINL